MHTDTPSPFSLDISTILDKAQIRAARKLEVLESGYATRHQLELSKKTYDSLLKGLKLQITCNREPHRQNKPIPEKYTYQLIEHLNSYLANYISKYGDIQYLFTTTYEGYVALAVKLEETSVILPPFEFLNNVSPTNLNNYFPIASLETNPLPTLDISPKEITTSISFEPKLELPKQKGIYLVEITDLKTNETFLKIGLTGNPLARFLDMDNYKVHFLNFIKPFELSVEILERLLLDTFQNFKYQPSRYFSGFTECFTATENLKTEILTVFAKYGRPFNKFEIELN